MRLKTAGLAILAMLVLGVMASTAFAALPDLHVLEGDTFPITLKAENTKTTTNLATAVSKLDGVGFTAKIECKELTSLCPYEATFKGVKEGKLPCKSGTEPAETVKVTGNEGHLVNLKTSPLTLGMLFLVKLLEVLCGPAENPDKVKIKIEGSVLGSINGVVDMVDIESIKGALKGEKGKQELTKYFNDEEKETTAKLLANFGLGFENADENVAEEVTFTASKMLSFLF